MYVHLPSGTARVDGHLLLGRGVESCPDDQYVSRQHCLLAHDAAAATASVTWMGRRPGRLCSRRVQLGSGRATSLQTQLLQRGAQRQLADGDLVILLGETGRYPALIRLSDDPRRPSAEEWRAIERTAAAATENAARQELLDMANERRRLVKQAEEERAQHAKLQDLPDAPVRTMPFHRPVAERPDRVLASSLTAEADAEVKLPRWDADIGHGDGGGGGGGGSGSGDDDDGEEAAEDDYKPEERGEPYQPTLTAACDWGAPVAAPSSADGGAAAAWMRGAVHSLFGANFGASSSSSSAAAAAPSAAEDKDWKAQWREEREEKEKEKEKEQRTGEERRAEGEEGRRRPVARPRQGRAAGLGRSPLAAVAKGVARAKGGGGLGGGAKEDWRTNDAEALISTVRLHVAPTQPTPLQRDPGATRPEHCWFGLGMTLNRENEVVRVLPGSEAAGEGIVDGDMITAVNGEKLRSGRPPSASASAGRSAGRSASGAQAQHRVKSVVGVLARDFVEHDQLIELEVRRELRRHLIREAARQNAEDAENAAARAKRQEQARLAAKRAPASPRAGTKEARTLQPPMRRDPYTDLPMSDEYFDNGVRFGGAGDFFAMPMAARERT